MDRSKRRLVWRTPTLLAALAYFWGTDAHQASGQIRVQIKGGRGGVVAAADDESEEARARVHPPTDRILSRGMRRAEETISGGEFADALRFLDEVLGRDEDYFVETGDAGGFSGLKEAARRLIRDLPPEGRRAYESTYAPIAERQLRDAAASGDAAQLEAIVQRYFFTPAGYQAALLLATQESDAGRHLSAALLYQQLLDTPAAVQLLDPALSIQAAASWLAADDAERARRAIDAVAKQGRATIEIGGRQYSLDASAGSLDWLRSTVGEPADVATTAERQWLTYRGNASRNGEVAGGLPHMRVRWNVRLLSPYPKLEELFEEYQANLVQSNRSTSVASAPLAVGDYIIVRSPHGLLAVDFRTGKRIWRSEQQRDHELEQLVRSGGEGDDLANAEPARSFARRMWEDYLYGVVSSDGSRVYAIRDLPMPAAQDYELQPFMSVAGAESSAPSNRLSAYDLATEGSLVWEIDGAAAKGDLAGAFFLGAPLAVGPSLYALLEIRDDVYLAALDRATGALQWRQQLANLETGVLLDIRRRLQAAMPSYDAGMLVCPTGAGLVVGIDLSKRSLAWAYRYETSSPFDEGYAGGYELARQGMANRWTDNAAMIVDDRVLMTPPESDELHCLDLRTGRVLWKHERGEMYSLAGVDEGCVLLVGSRKLAALNLTDGKPAWEQGELALPRDAAPAGQGFFSEGRYYLPLTTAEVVAVDVAEGRIASRVRARDGAALGNLICHRGTVLSQNGLFLDCFDQVDVLRARSEKQLAENATDVAALRSLGEIAYNEGRLSEAIELEERAYREAPDDLETRDMLAECLTEALDGDFASYQTRLPLLRELERGGAVSPLQVLRIEAQGQLAAGDPLASVAACLKLYRVAGSADEPLEIGREQQTNVARWVQAQVAAAWDAASADQRDSISTQLGSEAPALDRELDREKLERFLAFFGALPEFDVHKLALARRLDTDQRPIEAQQLYLDLVGADDQSVRGEAVARIAAGLHGTGLHMSAREFDRQLGDQFAEQECLDGATGRELLESWAEDAAGSSIDWPTGRVDVRNAPTSDGPAAARARTQVLNVRVEHGDSILGSGVGFLAARGEITWHDGLGREFFSAGLESQSQAYDRQTGSFYGVSRGNLLVLSLGRELVAFNTLPAGEGAAAPLVWRTSLGSNFDAQDDYAEEMARETPVRPGSFRAARSTLDGKWLGVIGPLTSGGCVIQDQRRLMCVDPFTGAVHWSRTDVPPGCDLFGDERYVFATPVGKEVARIYSAIDGRPLGKAKVGPWDERLTTRGRCVIRWSSTDGGKKELIAIDPLADEPLWRHEFDAATLIDLDRDRYAVIVERSGRAVVIDVETGETLLDQPIPAQSTAEQIHLMTSDAQFVLVVQHPASRNTNREVQPLSLDSPVVDGQVFAFDRKSGTMPWSRPAGVQQQALVLDQPAELPFLTFAGTLTAPNGGEGRESLTMLLLDKETGRTLFRSDELAQMGAGNCLARVTDGANHEVTIEMAGRSLTVQFTAARRPPEPPAMAEVESGAAKVATGLMGIFRSLGGAN
jgi:outer membrane protein assembly factor BamB